MPATQKSGPRTAVEPRVVNATGHPRSRWPSILAQLAESSVARRSQPAPGIVSSDNEDDRSMTSAGSIFSRGRGNASTLRRGSTVEKQRRGRKLVTSPACAPLDSFILLTQRMKRVVGEGSTEDGKILRGLGRHLNSMDH